MADQAQPPPTAPPPAPPSPARPDWGRRVLWGGIGLVVVVVSALAASAVVPRWWAQRVGDQVGGSLFAGFGLGLLYGLVFTAVPLTILWYTFRHRRSWKLWVGGVVLALIAAAPNLMTLAVVIGRGNAAHAGERIMDVEAPLFRGFVAVGALLAAAGFAFWRYQLYTRAKARREARRLRDELDRTRKAPPPGEPDAPE